MSGLLSPEELAEIRSMSGWQAPNALALLDHIDALTAERDALQYKLEDGETKPGIRERIGQLREDGDWCCEVGCGDGGCETCPCCDAGWCISGKDGIPDDPDDRAHWMEVAAEHNPLVPLLDALAAERDEHEDRANYANALISYYEAGTLAEHLQAEVDALQAKLESLREGPDWFAETQYLAADVSEVRTNAFQDGWASGTGGHRERTRAGIAALDTYDAANLRADMREVLAERDALKARLAEAQAGIEAKAVAARDEAEKAWERDVGIFADGRVQGLADAAWIVSGGVPE